MTLPKLLPDSKSRTTIEGLISETRALLAKLDAVAIANGAAWHVDAAINELYDCIGEKRPVADIENLAALLNQRRTASPH